MELLLTFCQKQGLYPNDWAPSDSLETILDEVLMGWYFEDADGDVTMFSDVSLDPGDEGLEVHEPAGFVLRWRNSAVSEKRLYDKPIYGSGLTVYQHIVAIFREHGPGGARERDAVELVLE